MTVTATSTAAPRTRFPTRPRWACRARPRSRAGRPRSARSWWLTQDRGYVREQAGSSEQIALRSHRYDRYPYYLEALRTRAERYNAQRERLWELEEAGVCLVIAPEEPVAVGSSTRDGESLLSLYVAGRRQATERLAEIEAFLA